MSYRFFIASRSYGKYSPKTREFLQEEGCKLDFNQLDRVYKEEDLKKIIADYDGIVVGVDEMTEEVIEAAENLKVIGKNGIGVDNIDLEAASEAGIPVVNIPGANSHSVADLAVGLMLSLARSIPSVNNMTKEGKWERIIGRELWKKKIGVIGTGSIGREIIRRLTGGFKCQIMAYDIEKNEELAQNSLVQYCDLEEIIPEVDYLSLNVPLTESTRNLIDMERLSKMKDSAYLINTARGGVVDEEALYQALKEGEIAGAACDVFAEEPPGDSKLFELDNFIATSHIGAFTYETNRRAGMGLARDMMSVLNGEEPKNLVNQPY